LVAILRCPLVSIAQLRTAAREIEPKLKVDRLPLLEEILRVAEIEEKYRNGKIGTNCYSPPHTKANSIL
jgi:hypothetical protein